MDIFSIIIFGIVSSLLCIVLKQYKAEYAAVLALGCAVILMLMLFSYVSPILDLFNRFNEFTGLDSEYAKILLKSLGICLISQIGSDICFDIGQTSIGSKIELAGKVAVLVVCVPLFSSVLNVIEKIINI